MTEYYAHSLEGKPPSEWQSLDEHLNNVAEMAADFAHPFGGAKWACLAGLLHDLGKGSKAFQAYLRHVNGIVDDLKNFYKGSVDHSSIGAQQLFAESEHGGKLLAYCVAGHHSGLLNWQKDAEHGMQYRLAKKLEPVDIEPDIKGNIPVQLFLTTATNNSEIFKSRLMVSACRSC